MDRRNCIRFLLLAGLTLPLTGCGERAPLDISYRQSLLDSAGLVMIVKNAGSKHLSCRMNVTSKVTGRSAQYVFSLAPHGSQEIGAVQADTFIVSDEFMEKLKFSECLPKRMVQELLRQRMLNHEEIRDTLGRAIVVMEEDG